MKITYHLFTVLAAISLTACGGHVLVRDAINGEPAICQVNGIDLQSDKINSGFYMGATKSKLADKVYMWVAYTPQEASLIPPDKPNIMAKGYAGEKITHEYRMIGSTYGASSILWKEYLTSIKSSEAKIPKDKNELEEFSIASNLWRRIRLGTVSQKVVIFSMNEKDFSALINSEKIKFIIKTNDDIVKLDCNGTGISKLLEFNSKCITAPGKKGLEIR